MQTVVAGIGRALLAQTGRNPGRTLYGRNRWEPPFRKATRRPEQGLAQLQGRPVITGSTTKRSTGLYRAMDEQNGNRAQNQPSKTRPPSTPNRRQFLGLLGAGVTVSAGISEPAGAQESPTVSMGNNYFDPVGLFIEPGTTVRFEIEAGSHSATAYRNRIPPGASPFDSGTISTGGFEHTFETPGTYDYYCIPHKSMGMVGRIVVEEPGGPAEATPIPDGSVPDSDVIVERGSVDANEFDASGGETGHGMMSSGGGMMSSREGMMSGGGPGWMTLVPVGFFTAVAGLVGGAVYWGSRRNSGPDTDDSAVATLETRYARGEIDEEEFRRRREQLGRDE